MQKDLPEAQQHVLDFLMERQQDGQPPPTLREIMRRFRLSQKPIESRLNALQAAGRITWQPGKSRTIRVLTPGQVWVAVPESRLPLVQAIVEPTPAAIAAVERWVEGCRREWRVESARDCNPSKVPL